MPEKKFEDIAAELMTSWAEMPDESVREAVQADLARHLRVSQDKIKRRVEWGFYEPAQETLEEVSQAMAKGWPPENPGANA